MSNDALTMKFQGAAAFGLALRGQLRALADEPARLAPTLDWSDPDFESWPLEETELQDDLAGLFRQRRARLQLYCPDFALLARRHPRFAQWRRPWAHAIDAWSPVPRCAVPALALGAGRVIEWLEPATQQGRVDNGARAQRAAREQLDTLRERCQAAWPVTLLGV